VVRVDEIDDRGKVSLSPVGDDTGAEGAGDEAALQGERSPASGRPGPDAAEVSFEDAFDAEAREVFGDLGPETATASSGDGGRRDGDRRRRHR
jgi:hypothetical protein